MAANRDLGPLVARESPPRRGGRPFPSVKEIGNKIEGIAEAPGELNEISCEAAVRPRRFTHGEDQQRIFYGRIRCEREPVYAIDIDPRLPPHQCSACGRETPDRVVF